MIQKEGKIHALGPKKLTSSLKPMYQSVPPASFTVTQPAIVISPLAPKPQVRYVMVQHPQFETLTKEFQILRAKYDELLIKFGQKGTQQSLKANIQEVIESTQNIEIKMSRIVEDANNNIGPEEEERDNQQVLQAEKAMHEQQCMQIIDTVNRATQKIEELQNTNKSLRSEVENHKQWRQALQKENKRLREMFQIFEKQKQEQVLGLKKEIQMLKKKQQQQRKVEEQASSMKESIINEELNNNPPEEKVASRVNDGGKEEKVINRPSEEMIESRSRELKVESRSKQQIYDSRSQNQKVQNGPVLRKINNAMYMKESQVSGEDVSGFSRMSVTGLRNKKSTVYF